MHFLHDLLFPHARNNHRAKLLHNLSIFLVLIVFIALSFFSSVLQTVTPEILGISYSISEAELLAQVNQKRAENGLAPLKINSQLSDAARRKASDMLEKDYWAHFAPDGSTSPWGFIQAAGYNYTFAGENLAKGFTDSTSTVNAWMASQTHRDNILSNKYEDVGFAIVPGTLSGEETVLIVEMFGASPAPFIAAAEEEIPETVEPEPTSTSEVITIQEPEPTPIIVAQVAQVEEKGEAKAVVTNNPTVDVRDAARGMTVAGFSFLAFAFVMDLAIVERKKIPRIVGHNLDHLMLIAIFLLFILLARGGVIL